MSSIAVAVKKIRGLLDLLSTIAVIATCAFVLWHFQSGRRNSASAAPRLPTGHFPLTTWAAGSPNAPVVLMEFADFQCPFCRNFVVSTLPLLRERYLDPGKVQMRFHEMPIEQLHPMARTAAIAAECSGQQGHFWASYDALFAMPASGLTIATIRDAVINTGLDSRAFDACTGAGQTSSAVSDAEKEVSALGFAGTPTFLIGILDAAGKTFVPQSLISGAKPYSDFSTALDAAISKIK